MSSAAADYTTCPNCGTALAGLYCAHCGQKATPLNPSFGEFLHDLSHEILHVDGKILQSTRLLLTRPGFLSLEQFEGRRARHVPPIRLYLIFSVLYFAVVMFAPLSGPNISCTTCSPETKAQVELEMRAAFGHRGPQLMFVLVPLFAAMVALLARRSGRNYPQHLYFAMHVHAAWFCALAVAALAGVRPIPYVTTGIRSAALVYCGVYILLAFRHAYRASLLKSVLAMAMTGVYLVFVMAGLLAIILPLAN